MSDRKEMVLVFAGPNGSGKSTVTAMINKVGEYINADDIARTTGCDNLTAALIKIPMLGFVDSLNVSNAAAICVYEAVRQRS